MRKEKKKQPPFDHKAVIRKAVEEDVDAIGCYFNHYDDREISDIAHFLKEARKYNITLIFYPNIEDIQDEGCGECDECLALERTVVRKSKLN